MPLEPHEIIYLESHLNKNGIQHTRSRQQPADEKAPENSLIVEIDNYAALHELFSLTELISFARLNGEEIIVTSNIKGWPCQFLLTVENQLQVSLSKSVPDVQIELKGSLIESLDKVKPLIKIPNITASIDISAKALTQFSALRSRASALSPIPEEPDPEEENVVEASDTDSNEPSQIRFHSE